jgi:hypothetical protein
MKRSGRPPDRAHPFGHGREAYVWSLFAALALFVAGAAVSVTYGVLELAHPEPASYFAVGYAVLAVSFVFEGISFRQSVRQARAEALVMQLRPATGTRVSSRLLPAACDGIMPGRPAAGCGAAGRRACAGTEGNAMTSSPGPEHLNNHHRDTLRQIFQHPASHNIEWRAVTSLLEAVGTVTVRHDGKVAVKIGTELEFLDPPPGKDIDAQMVVDLRRMLSHAGYRPS